MSPIELFRNDNHACLMYTDLADQDGQAVQCNQFLVVDHGTGAIIDPAATWRTTSCSSACRASFRRRTSVT